MGERPALPRVAGLGALQRGGAKGRLSGGRGHSGDAKDLFWGPAWGDGAWTGPTQAMKRKLRCALAYSNDEEPNIIQVGEGQASRPAIRQGGMHAAWTAGPAAAEGVGSAGP